MAFAPRLCSSALPQYLSLFLPIIGGIADCPTTVDPTTGSHPRSFPIEKQSIGRLTSTGLASSRTFCRNRRWFTFTGSPRLESTVIRGGR
ncbi:hypothetical protein PLICRDRAFT_52123 [Plicaturopsis crispa FD-325 SS-3]|nr:hypothetical protein PLICRDRAFT_52123 [Plicaturopsis crispa FD-325 SS-3]